MAHLRLRQPLNERVLLIAAALRSSSGNCASWREVSVFHRGGVEAAAPTAQEVRRNHLIIMRLFLLVAPRIPQVEKCELCFEGIFGHNRGMKCNK